MIVTQDTDLFDALNQLTASKRMLLVAGLPGVGKSLMLQQAALLARSQRRPTCLLRWDVVRLAFEGSREASAYPLRDGITHAAIRLAAGQWVRAAVARWHAQAGEQDLLIGECPLVGNRFSELAKRADDDLEPVLASSAAHFLVPAPSLEVRVRIESARAQELENPAHESELNNAPSNVMHALDDELQALAKTLGIALGSEGYHPRTYVGVYGELLRHRHQTPLHIEKVFKVSESPQAVPESCPDLLPSSEQVAASLSALGSLGEDELHARAAAWWQVDG